MRSALIKTPARMLQLNFTSGDTSPIPSVRIPARKWSSRLCSTRSLRENKNYKSGLPGKFRSRRRIWKWLCSRLWQILEAIWEWSLVTKTIWYLVRLSDNYRQVSLYLMWRSLQLFFLLSYRGNTTRYRWVSGSPRKKKFGPVTLWVCFLLAGSLWHKG